MNKKKPLCRKKKKKNDKLDSRKMNWQAIKMIKYLQNTFSAQDWGRDKYMLS